MDATCFSRSTTSAEKISQTERSAAGRLVSTGAGGDRGWGVGAGQGGWGCNRGERGVCVCVWWGGGLGGLR